jgi:hypothetical protein
MTDWDDDILGGEKTDDGIIELMDIVNDDPEDISEDNIIELTDIVKKEDTDFNPDVAREEGIEVEEDLELDNEVFADKGLELEISDKDIPVEQEKNILPDRDLSVTQEQMEAALERVIEKKFADKIETILFEVMEKVIEKEIAEIKESLQKDLDHIGNV